jgi:hypothetical protein
MRGVTMTTSTHGMKPSTAMHHQGRHTHRAHLVLLLLRDVHVDEVSQRLVQGRGSDLEWSRHNTAPQRELAGHDEAHDGRLHHAQQKRHANTRAPTRRND